VTPQRATDASLKFVARPSDLVDQQKLVPARYADQERSLFLISKLDFRSVWIGKGKQHSLEKKIRRAD